MTFTNIPYCLQGANLYLAIKYSLVDTNNHPEYELAGTFQREDDANEFISRMNSFEDNNKCSYKLIPHKMTKSSNSNLLLWNQEQGVWVLPKCESNEITSDLSNDDNNLIITIKDVCNYLGLPI